MKIYIGNNGSLKNFELMKKRGWGNVHLASAFRYPKKGIDWILDNGAYSCWIKNEPFDENAFEDALIKLENCVSHPDFVVVPDIVAGGIESLRFSLKWANIIPAGLVLYLAVQDGMNSAIVEKYIGLFDGLFVGGTLEWKIRTGKTWVDLAHSYNMKCHIGKVGTFRRLVWAKSIGADSVDSSTFVQVRNGLERIVSATAQTTLIVREP